MRKCLAPFIFVVHLPLQLLNLAVCASLVFIFGVIKLIVPAAILRGPLINCMHFFMLSFGRNSLSLLKLFNPVILDYRIDGDLSPHKWYLIIANHLSYLDIIVLIEFAIGKIPPPKFFLKQELIWLPFVGLGAWALDMPFMKRYSRDYLEKHPEKRGKDIQTTRHSCEKFKAHPTTVINFVEGTRFTPVKHHAKSSPFTHLLPPKAGGLAFTLAAMGNLFTNILDISLLYPENRKHPMLAMLCGQMTRIVVDVQVLEMPIETQGDYFCDASFRTHFQHWINHLWSKKDRRINQIMES